MKKIIITFFTVMALLIGLTACNFQKVEVNKIDPNADVSQKIPLKILMPYISEDYATNPAIDLINEITGYNTEYDQLPTAASAETNLTAIFTDKKTNYNALKLTKNQFNKYVIQAAAFADLTDVINSPKYSVIKNAIKPEAWEAVTYNGKIFGIPDSASNNNIDKAIVIRKDLMIKYGFNEVPKTFAEFKRLLQAFKDDTGYTSALTVPSNIPIISQIAASFGVEQLWQDIDGKLVHAIENPNMAKYIDAMKDLKDNGLLDTAMQQNSFATCASNFAQGKSIATISNFWEMEVIDVQLKANNKVTSDCVDYAYGFENNDGEIKMWQNSGVSYVTVVPNWMADKGLHVMEYIKAKLVPENFVRLVAGEYNVHYVTDPISGEFKPTDSFKTAKKSADHFVTGTNDNVYNKYWTQVVIKGNANYYKQWKASNTDAFADGAIGVLDPTKFAPALKTYSSAAAGMEDSVNTNIVIMIYSNNKNITLESTIASWKSGNGQKAIDEVNEWYLKVK